MKRHSLKQILLTLIIALLTMSWVGTVGAMPPGGGGFKAYLKGFPPGFQDTHEIKGPQNGKTDMDVMKVYTTSEENTPWAPNPGWTTNPGFQGAVKGNYPHGK